MRFEVFTAVKMLMVLLWVVMLCGLVGGYQHFEETALKMEAVCIRVQVHMASQPRRPPLTKYILYMQW
jgi:hypothetical protein